MKAKLLGVLAILVVIVFLAFQWFAMGWFSNPNCDPSTTWDHCEAPTGAGPGNGR